MLSCIAIDDEPLALDVLKEYIQLIPDVTLVKIFTSKDKAKNYLSEYPVDFIFLDIEMPGLNGVDFYRSLVNRPPVIFITAYSNYAVEGFELEAVDYLLKPIDPERLKQSVNRILSRKTNIQPDDQAFITIRYNYQLKNIPLSNIRYIEGLNDYVKIYMRQETQPILALMSMKEIVLKLPQQQFLRIHRSYIIPVCDIVSYNSKTVQLRNISLPIGDTYRRDIAQVLKKQ
ncbi:LytTR family DNA-binding domain-containing protein [Chitinophaga sp. CF418]|uniref:LytR/AlgR family response regulator transcription factor n=1 Tax=Chitinophaga sp. CF418 TaxID=1855287 RepID=UPI0009233269|nr:LytTR family DNA-binding domain-containing protein [Chitinophaga sp. CF418]SHN16380.1 two component transcriptional regulator, LytTR family [Chitinophaga sp. CF418]